MDIPLTPSSDVAVILHALLDKLENRAKYIARHATCIPEHPKRSIKVLLTDLPLPAYFSQTDPEPRLITNHQLQELAKIGLVNLLWPPGQTDHLLAAVFLHTEHATYIYNLLRRAPLAAACSRLESVLLADQFRFPANDWRARAVGHILSQLRAGKSPAPFSLTNAEWNLDLLTVLASLSSLEAETPYRVFSVRIFNDSKRFDEFRSSLVRLARRANHEWKYLPAEEILRELNLVANPNYIHLAGNWQITTKNGEVLSLGGFTPSLGFPAVQTSAIHSINIHADAVLCIENLTTFHEFVRADTIRNTQHIPDISCSVFRYAVLCTLGNPFPSIRHILSLVPDGIPIYLWADLDYGGLNILSQLRRRVRINILPYRMDIPAFDAHAHLSCPLTRNDERNLKNLLSRPELADVFPVIEHLLKRGLKLEQEAFDMRLGHF